MRTECAQPFYSVRICAHSVRMRTTTICCAQCAQPLRTDILCCAHSVRILCACSPTSVRSAQTLAVRILCALRTDVCGSFTPCLCAAHRLRTDAHRLSTLLFTYKASDSYASFKNKIQEGGQAVSICAQSVRCAQTGGKTSTAVCAQCAQNAHS